jgi:hypothetical protein
MKRAKREIIYKRPKPLTFTKDDKQNCISYINRSEYYKQLNEEYNVFPNGEIMDGDLDEWIKKDREQSEYLINRYGESAWSIHRFMELCRAEDISESFFRQLVRYEMDKCFKRLENEK